MLSSLSRVAVQLGSKHLRHASSLSFGEYPFLQDLGLSELNSGVFDGSSWGTASSSGDVLTSVNPSTGKPIASVTGATLADYEQSVTTLGRAHTEWSNLPLPRRGELVRQLGEALRHNKDALGRLISLEMGKILTEGLGEVQEAVDICEYAVGLSRSLNGLVIPSERPGHFMMERWNPLSGPVGIITAFNFPCAVFFWNAALSLVCGNTQIWKPAPSTSLVGIACQRILNDVLLRNGHNPSPSAFITASSSEIPERLVADTRVPLVSFTGSTKVGRLVAQQVASRFGRSLLELGGNNAMIVMDDADLTLAHRAALFSAVGTCGQRCTSLRRLYLHKDIHDEFLEKLARSYRSIPIGDALDSKTLCGPLHNKAAVSAFEQGVNTALAQGGRVIVGGSVLTDRPGNFVQPTIVSIDHSAPCTKQELFGPLLYVSKFDHLDQAIAFNNDVPQGLSSSLFTKNQSAIFKWTGPSGSDCGIANVNIGPSGAEIGGAFGGEKETGGGRESGSDSWKAYMRRSTCTVNYSTDLPLAQGVNFDV